MAKKRVGVRGTRWSALVLLLTVLAAFAPLIAGRFYAVGDVATVFIPLEHFFHTEQLAGRLPSWLPNAAWGFPVIAAAQLGFFYPPLLLGRLFPLPLYLSGLVLLHAAASLLGTYLFLRRLGRSREAAALGALAFGLGGYLVLHLTHLNIFFAAAWLPWQMLTVLLQRQRPQPLPRFIALLALLLAAPFLAGQIQVPFLLTLTTAAFYLSFLPLRRGESASWRSVHAVGILIITGALAAALAAIQLLPTLELAQYSNRSHGLDTVTANQYSYPLYHLPTTLFPRFFGNDHEYWGKRLQIEYGFYVGTIPLALALYVLCKKRHPVRQLADDPGSTQLRFFRWLFGVSFLLSLGSLSPFRLISLEPSLWLFSAPARWLLPASFAMAVLAAAGLDSLAKQPRRAARYLRSWFFALVIIITLSNAALTIVAAQPEHVWQKITSRTEKIASLIDSAQTYSVSLRSPYTYLPPTILLISLLSVSRRQKAASYQLLVTSPATRFQRVALLLTAAELAILALTTTPHSPWREIMAPPATLRALPADVQSGHARLYSVRDQGDTGAYFTDPASRPGPREREQLRLLLPPLVHSQFNLLGVEWPASIPLQTHTELLDTIREPGGYAVADAARAAAMNIGAVLAPSGDGVSVTTLPARPRFELQAFPPDKGGQGGFGSNQINKTLTIQELLPARQAFTVTTTEPATLIIRDTYFPGWQATIDGRPTSIHRTEEIFRRINIPPGQHEVVLEYKPAALRWGILVSLAAIVAIFVILGFSHRRNS